MIASAYRRGAERTVWAAFILSLLIHLFGAALYGVLAACFPAVRRAFPHPRPTETFVTLSESLTFDKRPRPVPRPRVVARPAAPPWPIVHVEPKRVLPAPMPFAHLPRVALAPPREEQPRVTRSENPSSLTQAQVARLNAEFSHAIAAAKGANDPLRVAQRTPSTIKRYRLQFEGRIGELKNGQGILTPIKTWFADGYQYYYVTYELVWPDGTYESGAVPWPIRYRPAEDPFANWEPGRHIPLPPPLSGWTLPAGTHLGKALWEYFPGYKDTEG